MKRRFRIKEAAGERGMTLSSIAEKLGIARSNMSSIASGRRGASLKVLSKIGRILDCGIDELILPEGHPPVYKDKKIDAALKIVENRNYDGIDKTWVNRVMLAHKAHFGSLNRGV